MSRPLLLAIGAVLVVVGVVWFLQGIDVLGGSGMSGKTTWAVIGPIVALVGVAVGAVGLRRRTCRAHVSMALHTRDLSPGPTCTEPPHVVPAPRRSRS